MEFNVDITGLEKLDKTFRQIPRSMQRKAYMQSLRAGAEPVKDAATTNIRSVSKKFSGVAARKNTLRIYNYKKYRGNYRVGVQVRRGLVNAAKRGKDGGPVRVGLYLAVLEYGSQKLNRKPRSWIRKAIREKKNEAVNNVRSEMAQRMPAAIQDAKR